MISQTGSLQSFDPANLEPLGEVPITQHGDVERIVEESWQAFDRWQLTNFHERSKRILALRRLIEKNKDEIAILISKEVGKPIAESYGSEIQGVLETCNWLIDSAEKHLKDHLINLNGAVFGSKQSVITFEPLGVVGIIAPWNYPFSIPMMTMLFSVYAGNAVVLKPSEKSSLVGIKIADLFREAGFPPGVVQVVTGDQSTGKHLSSCRLAKLIFTGSVGSGIKIIEQSARNVTPLSLELGGKDAAVVLADAPIEATARGLVWGAFTNAGQACASIERVYIVKGKRTEKLIEKIIEFARALKVGPATDSNSEVGPLIDEGQYNKVVAHLEEAVTKGARLACGGTRVADLKGFFMEPAVLLDANHSMLVMTEETFGPVLPIMVVSSEDEAVALANQSDYGLTASVWSSNLNNGQAVAKDLNVGTVYLNDCLFSHAVPALPWGGIKKSGFGKSHSYFGLLDLVNIKHISVDAASKRLWWYPYGGAKAKFLRAGIQLQHGSFFGKFKAFWDLLVSPFEK
jgi:succinate-semialdehyde dehydrogenase/glutarate-semialdehyde dehydrogenase